MFWSGPIFQLFLSSSLTVVTLVITFVQAQDRFPKRLYRWSFLPFGGSAR